MKILSFYRVSVITSILLLLLAIIFMFAPENILASWRIDTTVAVGLLTKRIAAVYIGFAVMLFMARNAEHSTTRTAIIYGIIVNCLTLASLGTYEFYVGHASSGILTGVILEILIVLAFMCAGCECKNPNKINKI
jgi:hypothetical protein